MGLGSQVESIGDITATEEVSGLETSGEPHRRRIQGGLLADGESLSLSKSLLVIHFWLFHLLVMVDLSLGIAA